MRGGHVREVHLGAADVDGVTLRLDAQCASLHRRQAGSVRGAEVGGGVGARYDVEGQDPGEGRRVRRQGAEGRRVDGGEGLVGRGEDRERAAGGQRADEAGLDGEPGDRLRGRRSRSDLGDVVRLGVALGRRPHGRRLTRLENHRGRPVRTGGCGAGTRRRLGGGDRRVGGPAVGGPVSRAPTARECDRHGDRDEDADSTHHGPSRDRRSRSSSPAPSNLRSRYGTAAVATGTTAEQPYSRLVWSGLPT